MLQPEGREFPKCEFMVNTLEPSCVPRLAFRVGRIFGRGKGKEDAGMLEQLACDRSPLKTDSRHQNL